MLRGQALFEAEAVVSSGCHWCYKSPLTQLPDTLVISQSRSVSASTRWQAIPSFLSLSTSRRRKVLNCDLPLILRQILLNLGMT